MLTFKLICSLTFGVRVALGIVLIWNPDSILCASSSQYADGNNDEGQLIKIVVCVCRPDDTSTSLPPSTSSLAEPNQSAGVKRARDSDTQDAINYMNIYGGWMQEGDICQGSILDIMVIRYSFSSKCQLNHVVTLSRQAESVKLSRHYLLFLQNSNVSFSLQLLIMPFLQSSRPPLILEGVKLLSIVLLAFPYHSGVLFNNIITLRSSEQSLRFVSTTQQSWCLQLCPPFNLISHSSCYKDHLGQVTLSERHLQYSLTISL